jgi:hypothetical protein
MLPKLRFALLQAGIAETLLQQSQKPTHLQPAKQNNSPDAIAAPDPDVATRRRRYRQRTLRQKKRRTPPRAW